MNRIALFIFSLLVCSTSFCDDSPNSTFIDRKTGWDHGKMNLFWAQESVGIPEARKILKEYQINHPLPITEVGIIDGPLSPHGLIQVRTTPDFHTRFSESDPEESLKGLTLSNTFEGFHASAVANLIAGPDKISASSQAVLSKITSTHNILNYKQSIEAMMNGELSLPPLINMSMGIPLAIKDPFEKLISKTIVVTSAGNSYPEPMDQPMQENKDRIIVVGSLSPEGVHSRFSQESDALDIMAPSDVNFMTSIGSDGKTYTRFGGTSGATPLVTGVVADIMALLPGITLPEIESILKKSAFTVNSPIGALNAPRAIQSAIKLKTSGWPSNRDFVSKRRTYRFRRLSTSLYEEAIDNSRVISLSKLRLAAFLNPKNNKARTALYNEYLKRGNKAQALYFAPPKFSKKQPLVEAQRNSKKFVKAVANGNLKKVKRMLKDPQLINSYGGSNDNPGSSTLMAIAARLIEDKDTAEEMLELLDKSGATFNARDSWGPCGVFLACSAQAWIVSRGYISLYEKHHHTFNKKSHVRLDNVSLFEIAIENHHFALAQMILDDNPEVIERQTDDGKTPLVRAIYTSDQDAIYFLLKNNAETEYATQFTDGELVKNLLRKFYDFSPRP